jgi:hypothetical protein
VLKSFKRALAVGTAVLTVTLVAPVLALPASQAGVDWSAGTITVVGEGVMPAKGSAGQRRLMAKRAAMVDGYRKLAEVVEGVSIDAHTSVHNFETESDDIRAEVSGLVKGAQATEENITADNVYEVRLVLPLYGAKNSLASAVLLTSLNSRRGQSLLAPVAEEQPAASTGTGSQGPTYTGVIIEATGIGAKHAMAPGVIDEAGREIYIGKVPYDNEEVLAKGCVGYAKSVAAAREMGRAGEQPLVLKAKAVRGPFRADYVLKNADAQRLLEADQRGTFLKELAVVIVM